MGYKAKNLASLKKADEQTKPCGADTEWINAHLYYDDSSRSLTSARLRELRVGIRDNTRPLEVSLLRRIIDRLAVIYARAPTRWFCRGGERLAETSDEHVRAIEALTLAQYDLAWRHVDRLRALLRQVVLRFYPDDTRRGVVLRVFEPYNVIREPGRSTPDTLDQDARFALMLSGTPGREEVWEYWEHLDGGAWEVSWVDQGGRHLEEQPFERSSLISPYASLPCQIVYDNFTGGRPWLSPRCSRTSWVEAINGMSNDLWALVVNEAHSQRVVSTNNTEDVPQTTGPSTTWVLPKDAEAEVLSGDPKLEQSQGIVEFFTRLWSLSEDLPVSEFDRAKQVVTGAALKVQSQPLLDRREAQAPLAELDERAAWMRFRSVWNVHAPVWQRPTFAEDLDVEVELADMDVPSDMRELQEAGARSLALGTKSVIDLIMAEQNCPRHAAIKIYERVKADNETFPARLAEPGALQSGPRMTDVPAAPNGPEQMAGAASVTDAIAKGGEPAPGAGELEPGDAGDALAAGAVDKAQDTALNGAQVQAAQGIIKDVAAGLLPRETGVAMLVEFFNLDAARADRIMGPVGRGFKPASDAKPAISQAPGE